MSAHAPSGPKDGLFALYEAHEGKVSDKWTAYLALYETAFRRLRDQPVRLLEIGVQNGGSLEIWSQFFTNAQKIVGCDINERCRLLTYDDPRIEVVVGDANDPKIVQRITSISPEYDIIIDDGSHMSSDIVRSFGLYFPVVSTGGIYVAEDLHCSYRDSYEGGIEAPYSSLAFFRRLTDQINREHWGAPLLAGTTLSFFADHWNALFDNASLGLIEEVAFRNSSVIVSKGKPEDTLLGRRRVAGRTAIVEPAVQSLSGLINIPADQRQNAYGPLAERSETQLMTLPGKVAALEDTLNEKNAELAHLANTLGEKKAELVRLASHADRLEACLAMTEAELVETRQRPHKALVDKLGFHVLRGLSKSPLPVPSKMRSRFARGAAKRDPKRK